MEHPQSTGKCVCYRGFSFIVHKASVVLRDVFVSAALYVESGTGLAGGSYNTQVISMSKVLPV